METYNLDPSPTDPKYLCSLIGRVVRRKMVVLVTAVASVHIDTELGIVGKIVKPVEVAVSVQSDLARGYRFHIAKQRKEKDINHEKN